MHPTLVSHVHRFTDTGWFGPPRIHVPALGSTELCLWSLASPWSSQSSLQGTCCLPGSDHGAQDQSAHPLAMGMQLISSHMTRSDCVSEDSLPLLVPPAI
jgi:hypothetical protein